MHYSRDIELKWQQRWDREGLADFDWSKVDRKLYVLEMFSYPSGANLHIGHWWNYGLTDSWARMKKMQGYEVFQPMGFDAFGLPAENYAIKTGTHPEDSTRQNIATMEKQLKAMGAMFNWEHELATCDPEYYRWNQWLFLKLLEHNLAYRKKAPVNWCPSCNTVLANEQVGSDGTCERCSSLVEKKQLTQWFFKITDYAEELLQKLPELDWPEKTKKIQENWIGKSTGAIVDFDLEMGGELLRNQDGQELKLSVFTTRVDTLMGVSYVVVAPEAELTDCLISPEQSEQVAAYRERCKHLSEIERQSLTREKTGVFTGAYAVHPLSGEKIPVWTSDYVIASYGTGAVMAVPAHDERDFQFAQKFDLPIKTVIVADQTGQPDSAPLVEAYTEDGYLVNSAEFDGLSSQQARSAIAKKLVEVGKGQEKIMYRLRDWLVSRQRYWGTPIPVIHCPKCGAVPVPESDLPVKLPYNVTFTPDGESPLHKCREYIETSCPTCGGPAERDPDTLDTFVCSSWYQFRYVDNKNDQVAFDRDKVNQLCPVDRYVGGAEHAAMHLLYSRFITKALRDMGYLDFDEPFRALTHQGTILGPDGQKMSKSKGNTVNPDHYIEELGSDVFRLYLAFGFAYVDGGPWSDDGIKAVDRFLKRVQRLVNRLADVEDQADTDEDRAPALLVKEVSAQELAKFNQELEYQLHYTIREVTKDAERFQFNTSIARLMELMNFFYKYAEAVGRTPELVSGLETFLKLLAPFAPHFAEEAWAELGHDEIIFRSSWPEFDPAKTVRDEVEIAVQINGKLVDRITVSASASQAEVEAIVKAHPDYSNWLSDRNLARFIYVPKRLANLVVKA